MAKQMTPGQRRKANALIRKTCCNYDNGNCIALDDGRNASVSRAFPIPSSASGL